MLRTVLALIGVYVAGVVVGALIAIVTKPSSGVPVAVASPTPSAVSPTIATTPTLPPATSTATPVATLTPTPTAPPRSPPPTPVSTPTPTVTPATPPSTAVVADPADIPAFMDELGEAIANGTDELLFTSLHPAVLERYGNQACRRYTRSTQLQGLDLEYVSANGPEPWDWVLDDRTTTIPDGWTVTVNWHDPNVDEAREVHIAPSDGTWRWFTDCGDPLT